MPYTGISAKPQNKTDETRLTCLTFFSHKKQLQKFDSNIVEASFGQIQFKTRNAWDDYSIYLKTLFN